MEKMKKHTLLERKGLMVNSLNIYDDLVINIIKDFPIYKKKRNLLCEKTLMIYWIYLL